MLRRHRSVHRARSGRARRPSALVLAALLASAAVPVAGAVNADEDNPNAFNIERYNGIPIHWNKCAGIGYRINYDRAPRRAGAQVQEAVRRLENRSGLNFVYRGATSKFPSLERDYPNDSRLLLGWTTPSQSEEMPRGVLGVGGYQAAVVLDDGEYEAVITKGFVQLNAAFNDELPNGFGRGNREGIQGTKGQVMMHELGHAVGLGHVGNDVQIMFGTATRKYARWGEGDANGLQRVGRLRDCVDTPPASAPTRTVVIAD